MDMNPYLGGLVKALENHVLPKEYLQERAESCLADWKALADESDAAGQYLFGQCLLDGIWIEQDQENGLQWIVKAAEQGFALAQYRVSVCFMNGLGLDQDFKQAMKFAHFAAENGLALGWHTVGFLYEHAEKDSEKALEYYQYAADKEVGDAICAVANYYMQGIAGIEKNLDRAIELFRDAAEKKVPQAMNNLACFYAQGTGVEQNDEIAGEWGLKAAALGMVEAQLMMGSRCCDGVGVPENVEKGKELLWRAKKQGSEEALHLLVELEDAEALYEVGCILHRNDKIENAVSFYQRAARQEHAIAQYNLAWCLGTGTGIEQNQEQAAALYEASAKQGFPAAQYEIGVAYLSGELGVEKNQQTAMKWLREAANQGDVDAIRTMAQMGEVQVQYHMGSLYQEGKRIEQNVEEAEKWYRMAAEQGMPEAQFNLVWCLRTLGKEQECAMEIFQWLEKSAEGGTGLAQYELAMCYIQGNGVDKNKGLADLWLNKAAAQGHPDAMILTGNLSGVNKEGEFMKDVKGGLQTLEGGFSNLK